MVKLNKFLLLIVFAFSFSAISAQTPTPTPTPTRKAPRPSDVESVDAIMKAVYDVISGDAGQKRDWDRFRSLFHNDARLIPTGAVPNTPGAFIARALTPEDYIVRGVATLEKDGFFEQEIFRKTEQFGNIVHAFSTYEARRKRDDKTPFLRGINSFQLFYDGSRWWVMTIYWQAESKDLAIPKEYLKSGN